MSFLAVVMVSWYFRKRKELIRFIKSVIEELEDVFKPTDKIYELLGYLVGFRAKFQLGRSSNAVNAYIMLTTVPTYSLLYYPIAKALSRKNMLSIAVEFRGVINSELHIVKDGGKKFKERLRTDVQHIDKMRSKDITLLGTTYKVYYDDPTTLDLVLKELSSLSGTGLDIFQISIYRSKNTIYVVAEAKKDVIRPIYKLVNTIYSRISK